jgi:hypothetical protein
MPPRSLGACALLVSLLLSFASVSAQTVTFTITATSTTGDYGYTNNASYTFIFTADGSRSASDYGSQGEYGVSPSYIISLGTEVDLWTSISGTGVSQTYVTPGSDMRRSEISMGYYGGGRELLLSAQNETESGGGLATGSIGLALLDGSVDLSRIYTSDLLSNNLPDFQTGSVSGNLATFFSAFTGTYNGPFTDISSSPLPSVRLAFLGSDGEGPINTDIAFTITSVAITVTPVPEPGTYAALAGLAALAFVVVRRRRRA